MILADEEEDEAPIETRTRILAGEESRRANHYTARCLLVQACFSNKLFWEKEVYTTSHAMPICQ